MSRKRYSPEQIIGMQREANVSLWLRLLKNSVEYGREA